MPKLSEQRVPYFEHPSVQTLRKLNWEDIRIFLATAQSPSFRTAADQLGLSFNTVRRHIDRLEHSAGVAMFARHAKGVELTREGRMLLESAKKMETAAADVGRLTRHDIPGESGRVRINVTEGLGTFWLVPRLVRFQRAHPNIIVEANCTFREPDMARMEADISIQLTQPPQGDLKIVRLGTMHVIPFASPDYLSVYGRPTSLKDIASHKIVEQLSPQLDLSAVDRLFPGKPREGFVSFVTNTSTAHLWAVARGAGLGMLPTYVHWLGANVVPVDVDLRLNHAIWMTYHPNARKLRRIGLLIDFIKDNFDRKLFPCFSDEYIAPDLLQQLDANVIAENRFAALLAQ
jgi:DNA-binding transcriptional LysR family regulator